MNYKRHKHSLQSKFSHGFNVLDDDDDDDDDTNNVNLTKSKPNLKNASTIPNSEGTARYVLGHNAQKHTHTHKQSQVNQLVCVH
jgi:hypothetical protein